MSDDIKLKFFVKAANSIEDLIDQGIKERDAATDKTRPRAIVKSLEKSLSHRITAINQSGYSYPDLTRI